MYDTPVTYFGLKESFSGKCLTKEKDTYAELNYRCAQYEARIRVLNNVHSKMIKTFYFFHVFRVNMLMCRC